MILSHLFLSEHLRRFTYGSFSIAGTPLLERKLGDRDLGFRRVNRGTHVLTDGKRFVMVDEDGTFSGTVVNNDTLDYCYTHITPTDRAVCR